MTPRPVDETPGTHRLRFELIFGSLLLAAGLFVMPALVYWVGTALLGPYGEGAGAGTFYGDFFGDLASGSGRAWTLALGPLVLISMLRLIFLRRPAPDEADQSAEPDAAPRPVRPAASSAKPANTKPANRRVEPRVTLD
jgi:hypothetical protein